MKLFSKFSTISALLVLLTFSMASQAAPVFQHSGSESGSWADFGVITLNPGSYTLDLTAFTFGGPGPTIFGIANLTEAFQVAVASFGMASTAFTTVGGGTFTWGVGGLAGAGTTVFQASVNAAPVPLPSSVIMIGSALAAMVSIGRRGASRRARA